MTTITYKFFRIKVFIFKKPLMADFALFWFISFIKIYSFCNINFFIQQHFYNSLGLKFFIMSITSSCHIKHKASIINIIYSNYCKFSKRFYFPITTITKFWSRFKTIVEILHTLLIYQFNQDHFFRIVNSFMLSHFYISYKRVSR